MDDPASLRVRFRRLFRPLLFLPGARRIRGIPAAQLSGEDAQRAIARAVREGGQLVARIGSVEAHLLQSYVRGRKGRGAAALPYPDIDVVRIRANAGFFPAEPSAMDRLAELYLQSVAMIDLHAVWTPQDRMLQPPHARSCELQDLEPFFTRTKWTHALEGRRVCVVSPFRDSILAQWQQRDALFAEPTMPACDLSVVKAPQTFCAADVDGQDWFENLDRMDREVAAARPDVVLIGCGAYGLPLGAKAKARGASAVVIGGATQLLFGIMGNRWIERPEYAALMTDAWTRPGEQERPPGFDTLEQSGGAYW